MHGGADLNGGYCMYFSSISNTTAMAGLSSTTIKPLTSDSSWTLINKQRLEYMCSPPNQGKFVLKYS